MRKLLYCISFFLVFLVTPVLATDSTNNTAGPVQKNFLTNTISSPFISARIGYGINSANKNQVFAMSASMPLSSKTQVGLVGAYIGKSFYEGGLNLSYGATNNLPYLGTIYSYAGDGMIYNFRKGEIANYAFSGINKDWIISSKCSFGIGIAVANTSDMSGLDFLIGTDIIWRF